MIEEIIHPSNHWYVITLLTVTIGFGVIATVSMFKYDRFEPLVVGSIIFVVVLVVSIYYVNEIHKDWKESVQLQVDTLGCKDLQEAHDIYGLEYIKEKFLFECVDTREAWWN